MNQHNLHSQRTQPASKRIRFFSFLLATILLLNCLSACKKEPTNEELIENRITTFVTAYNDGDMDTVLSCLDAKTRNAFQAMLNILGGLAGSATGFNIDLSDLFSLGVSTTSGDFMQLEVTDITVIDSANATATTTMFLTGAGTQIISFEMVYENNGWYISDMTDSQSDHSNNDNNEPNDSPSSAKIQIDPFAGIEYTVIGISPYCEVIINNQNCDIKAQKYVTYSFDNEKYANGDTVIITATIDFSVQEQYSLSKTTHEYIVQNQPEYITSINNLNLLFLESELQDYIDSQCSAALGTEFAFGENLYAWSFDDRIVANINPSLQENYFSSLKLVRINLMNNDIPFNKLSFVYKINITANDNSTETLYVNISALNIVKYADDSIKWGTISSDSFNFTHVTYISSLEECVGNTITANKTNYNITKIN